MLLGIYAHLSIHASLAFFRVHFSYCIAHRLAPLTGYARLLVIEPVAALDDNLVGILFHALDGYFERGKNLLAQRHVPGDCLAAYAVLPVCRCPDP